MQIKITTNDNHELGPWSGGPGAFTAQGAFDGATAKLEFTTDGTTWDEVGTYTTLIAGGGGEFRLPKCQLRVTTTGGGGSLDITAVAF